MHKPTIPRLIPEKTFDNRIIFHSRHDSHEQKSLHRPRIQGKRGFPFLGPFQVQHRNHKAVVTGSAVSGDSAEIIRWFESSWLAMEVGT